MPETTFLLIRHGAHLLGHERIAGHMPVSLSPLGQEQAGNLPARLSHIPIAALYCSPVQRTRETAAPLAAHLGLPVQISDALAEVDFGDWTGQSLQDLREQELWRQWNSYRSGSQAPHGERMTAVQSRIVDELHRLRAEHPGQVVAVVSHGDVIKAAVAHFLGTPLDLFLRIEISLVSVTVVQIGDYGPWVLCVNNTERVPLPGHL